MPSRASLWRWFVRGADAVAGDQLRVVEVVAGVHAHAFGQAAAHRDLLVLVEQRDLDAVDLARIRGDDAERRFHRAVEIVAAPVAGQRRIEHVAEPVQDHRLLRLGEDAVVDALVVGRAGGDARERAARHHDQLAAERLDRFHLRLVGADHVVDARGGVGGEVIGAAARGDAARPGGRVRRRASGGSARARSASRGPCRAAPCPSPRRRRGRATTGAADRRSSRPSRARP